MVLFDVYSWTTCVRLIYHQLRTLKHTILLHTVLAIAAPIILVFGWFAVLVTASLAVTRSTPRMNGQQTVRTVAATAALLSFSASILTFNGYSVAIEWELFLWLVTFVAFCELAIPLPSLIVPTAEQFTIEKRWQPNH
jgi:hypothetical protein